MESTSIRSAAGELQVRPRNEDRVTELAWHRRTQPLEEKSMGNVVLDRRDLLLAPLFAAAASSFEMGAAQAAGVDPAMTIVVPPDQIPWKPLYNFPQGAAEQAPMFGAI